MNITVEDAMHLVENAPGYEEWIVWLTHMESVDLREALLCACANGLVWGAQALGVTDHVAEHVAAFRAWMDADVNDEFDWWGKYKASQEVLAAAVVARVEALLTQELRS